MNCNPTTVFTYKDLLLRKLYLAVMCSVLSHLLILQLYVLIANFDLLHPGDWIVTSFKTFTSISTLIFIVPFITIIFAQSIICAKDYVFKSTYCSTRFQKILSIFSMHNFVLLFLHVLVGAILVWLYLNSGHGAYSNLAVVCHTNKYCLVEGTLFLILGGLYIGLYFFLKVYISEKHLMFPVIYQRKMLQLKANLLPLFKNSVILAAWPTLHFILIYYIWGNQIKFGVANILHLLLQDSDTSYTYLYLWWLGTLYIFSMNLMRFFFNMFLTEPVELPILKQNDTSLTLQDSIVMFDLPIVQNLACLDLNLLAQWSPTRRQVYFSLSPIGGHPHNWNNLVENVLKLFTEYIELLNKSTNLEPVQPVKPAPALPCLQSPPKFGALRNMSMCMSPEMLDIVNVTHNPLPKLTIMEKYKNALITKINNITSFLKVILGINFFFGELPQANIQKCLANGHLIMWTSQGISDLVCASLTEDQFGIVQKDLPVIINTLVKLKQSLENLNKVPSLTRKVAGFNDFNYKMKVAITATVRRSLFNIDRTFKEYL